MLARNTALPDREMDLAPEASRARDASTARAAPRARETVVSAAIELAERGWLPDVVVRNGIGRFCRERLREQDREGVSSRELADQLRSMPIALHTGDANAQHYEVPSAFFQRVLGPRLKYSCAYWPSGVRSLEEAEEVMLELTRQRALVEDGMEVLDLGCGWGSFSLWLAERQPRSRIVAVSNSSTQRALIEARAAANGLRNLTVLTADVASLELTGRFDRIVTIEMLEHMRNYELILSRMRQWLRPDGRVFAHVFCHRRHAYLFGHRDASDWMARHFFTGGTMPSFDLFSHFQNDLAVRRSWWLGGTHYARTAEAWLDNVDEHADELGPLLVPDGPRSKQRRAVQRWRLFFLACAEMFARDEGEQWGVGQYVLGRSS